MLAFSRTTGYAILALGCLERTQGAWVLSKQINACTGIPMPYLRKILHALGKAGLVETKRGYQGGFRLAQPAGEIRLIDVITAVEGEIAEKVCILGLRECNDKAPCPLHSYAGELRQELLEKLRNTSVADVGDYARSVHSELLRCATRGETAYLRPVDSLGMIDASLSGQIAVELPTVPRGETTPDSPTPNQPAAGDDPGSSSAADETL
ncbi:hypothetical protein JCM19992_23440 [Thermostilla marina]